MKVIIELDDEEREKIVYGLKKTLRKDIQLSKKEIMGDQQRWVEKKASDYCINFLKAQVKEEVRKEMSR